MANDQRKGKGTSREKQIKSAASKEKDKVDKQSQKKETKRKQDGLTKDASKSKSLPKKAESSKKLEKESKEPDNSKGDSSKKPTNKKTDMSLKHENTKKNDSSSKKADSSKKSESTKTQDTSKKGSTKKKPEQPTKAEHSNKADHKTKSEPSKKNEDKKFDKKGEDKSKSQPSNSVSETGSKKTDSKKSDNKKKSTETQSKKSETKKTECNLSKSSPKVVSTAVKSKVKKPVGKSKKVTPAAYKSRHNIGRRTAAERVGSYSEAEVALVFPEGYWNPVKVDSSPSASTAEASPDKTGKKRAAEGDKKSVTSPNKSTATSKKAKTENEGDRGTGIKASVAKSEIESDSETSESESDNDTSYKASIKKKVKGNSKGAKVKKVGGKYADLWPRAPRIKRTACLNAGAIMSVMYEKEEPLPKKAKVDVIEFSKSPNNVSVNHMDADDGSKDSESSSDSEFKPTKIKTEKEQKRKVNLRVKLTAKKLTSKIKEIKKNIVKKKNVKKKADVKKEKTKMQPVFTPPRRMASLNAQAIWAAAKDDRLPKLPKGKQKESPPKVKPKREESPVKEKMDSTAAPPAETKQPPAPTTTAPSTNKESEKPVNVNSTGPETVKTSSAPITTSSTACKPGPVQPGMTSPHVQFLSNMPPGGSSIPKSTTPSAVTDRPPAPSPMHERGVYRTPLPTPSPDVQILEIKPPMATSMPPGFSNIPPNMRQSHFMQSQSGNMYPSSYTPHHERFQNPAYPNVPAQYPMTSRSQRPYHSQHYPHLAHPHSQSQQSPGYPQPQGQPIYTQPSMHNQSHTPNMYSQPQGMFHKTGPESQALSPRYMPPRMPSQPLSSQAGLHSQHGPSLHTQSGQMMQHMPSFHPRYPAYQQYPLGGQSRTPLPNTQQTYPSSNVSSSQSRTPHNPPQIQPLPSFPPNTQSSTPVTKPKVEPHGTLSPSSRYPMRTDKTPMGYPHPSPVMSTGMSAAQHSQQAQQHQSQQGHQQSSQSQQQQSSQQSQTGSQQQQQRGGDSSAGGHDQAHTSSPIANSCTAYPYPHGSTNVPPSNHCQPYMVGSVTMDTNSGYPVMPFRHYGSTFTVPSFEEAQQIRFGYYQPAGPLIQTVPHDPCCVPHPLGMPVPHPQVKVLVHNAPPGYAADPQFPGMMQPKQSSMGPEGSIQGSQDRSSSQPHRVETHEASTSPAKQPKEEKKDRTEQQKRSEDRDRSQGQSDDGEKLDIITIGEMDSASMKALSNRQKKSKKSDELSTTQKKDIKAEAKYSTPDQTKTKQAEASTSKTEAGSKKVPEKKMPELIKAESSKKAPPSKVTQGKKGSDTKPDKAQKRKGDSQEITGKADQINRDFSPPKKVKSIEKAAVTSEQKKATKENIKQKQSTEKPASVPKKVPIPAPKVDKGDNRTVNVQSAAQKPALPPATSAISRPEQIKTMNVKPAVKPPAKPVTKDAPSKSTLVVRPSEPPKPIEKVIPSKTVVKPVASGSLAAKKTSEKNTQGSVSTEGKGKAKKTATKKTPTPANHPVTATSKSQASTSIVSTSTTAARPGSNLAEAVSMIVTGQRDLPKETHRSLTTVGKCQALDLSSPVKNPSKPKFPAPADNEPLNLVIHSKSADISKPVPVTCSKVLARPSSVDSAKGDSSKGASSVKQKRVSSNQARPVASKEETRAPVHTSSKDAIAKLRQIRPSMNPVSSAVKIRPKPAATVANAPKTMTNTMSAVVGMQIMATPRLQIPGQAVTLPVSSQTITIRRPSGDSNDQQRQLAGAQALKQVTATHTLQSPIRTPITAPTLLGIVRPAQPGQLGLVQMQTYPTGLITTAGVISQATMPGPARVAVAKPIIPSKHKPIQPKPAAATSTVTKSVVAPVTTPLLPKAPVPPQKVIQTVATVAPVAVGKTVPAIIKDSMVAKPGPAAKSVKTASTHYVTRTKATIGVASRGAKPGQESDQTAAISKPDVVQTASPVAPVATTSSSEPTPAGTPIVPKVVKSKLSEASTAVKSATENVTACTSSTTSSSSVAITLAVTGTSTSKSTTGVNTEPITSALPAATVTETKKEPSKEAEIAQPPSVQSKPVSQSEIVTEKEDKAGMSTAIVAKPEEEPTKKVDEQKESGTSEPEKITKDHPVVEGSKEQVTSKPVTTAENNDVSVLQEEASKVEVKEKDVDQKTSEPVVEKTVEKAVLPSLKELAESVKAAAAARDATAETTSEVPEKRSATTSIIAEEPEVETPVENPQMEASAKKPQDETPAEKSEETPATVSSEEDTDVTVDVAKESKDELEEKDSEASVSIDAAKVKTEPVTEVNAPADPGATPPSELSENSEAEKENSRKEPVVPSVKIVKVEAEVIKESVESKVTIKTESKRVSSPGKLSAASSRSSSPRGKLSPDKALMASLTLSTEDAKALDSLIMREPVVVLEEIDLHISPSGDPEPSTSTGVRNLSPRLSPLTKPAGARSPGVMRGRQISPTSKVRRDERKSPTSRMAADAVKKNLMPNPRSRVGVTQAWQWEGEPEWKPVYPQVELPPVLQECYPAVRHFDGDMIRVRDCVLVRSGPRKRDIPYVAKISALWKSSETGEMMMNVFWYYRPEHTETDRLLSPTIPAEVFASKHRDVIPVACIEDRCYVLTFNEFCRYKSELMRNKQGCKAKQNLVPPGEDDDLLKGRMPAVDANPETVFLCRKVYDVKLKRVLKNPQIHTSPQP